MVVTLCRLKVNEINNHDSNSVLTKLSYSVSKAFKHTFGIGYSYQWKKGV